MNPLHLHERLRRWAAERPRAAALVDPACSLSYRELLDTVHAAGRQHRLAGIGAGDRVGLRARNDVVSVVALLGLTGIGAVPILLDPAATDSERKHVARLARIRRWVDPVAPDPGDAEAGARDWEPPSAVGVVTSGTNGVPKVVCKHWATTLANSAAFAGMAQYRHTDRVLCTTPVHHAFAFGTALLPTLHVGGTLVFAPHPPVPSALAAAVTDTAATVVQAVPLLYKAMLAGGVGPGHRLRTCVSAGEPMPGDLVAEWAGATGVRVRNQYGASEMGQISFEPADGGGPAGVLVPGISARIRRAGAPADGAGEIWVRLRGRHSRYWGQPELTRESFPGGWFRTGDWGRLLPDGRLSVEGRLTRRINVGGKKVDPVEVETAVAAFPGVSECVVSAAGQPPDSGLFVAFVAAEAGVTETAVRRHLARKLSAYKIPARLYFMDRLPRTGSGKVHLARLHQRLEQS